ncbi:MAG: hypothetical protein ACTTKX_00415 [Treponema sp.]
MSFESNTSFVEFFNDPFVFDDGYDDDFDDDEPDADLDEFDDDAESYEEAFEDEFDDVDEPYDDVETEDGYGSSIDYGEDELLDETSDGFDEEDSD